MVSRAKLLGVLFRQIYFAILTISGFPKNIGKGEAIGNDRLKRVSKGSRTRTQMSLHS